MRLKTKALVVLVAAVAVTAVAGGGASATTNPAVQITIKVTVTDSGVKMSQYTARRGWGAHFVIRNNGKKAHVVDIGGLRTHAIKPGRRAVIKASLETRGKYPFGLVVNANTKQSGFFRVV
jgi:hypothetical protein